MKPIPTTNAMKPAPGKGVSSFPTPVIKDTVIVEVINAWKGDYTPLEYGTNWDDVPHASVQGSFPDHKLINQSPNSEDGQWVKRIWANDRVDQDTYNYAIKYSGGSDQHPIYIRTYIEPRDTYAPIQDGTPDPLFPGAVLVDEEVDRESSELDSRYVKVTRVYETLPGPVIPTQRYNERGDLETVNTQTVAPNTAPDPDGLLVTQSQVVQEEVSKGVKTTATVPSHSQLLIKEKKEGLLGETITTDDIVDPATNPDALSTSVIASTVQQASATKAVRRTTTAIGPTSLTAKSKDGKLLGDVSVTESIVAPNAEPDTPSGVTTGILSSEVRQIDSGKAVKKNTNLNSTPTLIGSASKSGLLGKTITEETIVPSGTAATPPSLTVISSSVDPIDTTRSRRVVTSSTSPTQLSATSLVDSPVGQVPATVQQSIVPPDQAPSGGKLVLQDQISPIDEGKSQRERITVDSYPNLTTYSLDEGLNVVVITERTVVDHNAPYTTKPLLLSSEDRPLDQWKTLRITSRLSALPPKRIEFKTQQFAFPALLAGVNVKNLDVGFGRVPINEDETEFRTNINKFVSVTPNLRPSVSMPTRIRIETEFFYGSAPTPENVYQITTQSVAYGGSLFNFNFGDVITNAITIPQSDPIVASTFDSRYAGLSESVSFSASIPNYTDYMAKVNSSNPEVVVFSEVEYVRSNLWTKTTGYIRLI